MNKTSAKTSANEALKMAIEGYVECLEDMADWAAYASDYFQDKHDLEGNIQAHKQKIQACKEALEQEEVSDAELVSYRQGYEQGRFDYEMDLELGKIEQPAQEPLMYGDAIHKGLSGACKPAQEPVAWTTDNQLDWLENENNNTSIMWNNNNRMKMGIKQECKIIPLYTHPAPSWQGLSDYERHEIWDSYPQYEAYSRAIEQALKEKNT